MLIDRLIKEIEEKESPIVVGLDPRYNLLPEEIKSKYKSIENPLERASKAILEFNCGIIDSIYDLVPAIKPQVAFYEQLGLYGMITYAETIKYAKEKGLIIIGDIKRGDIGSTSRAYSNAHIGHMTIDGEKVQSEFVADFITVNPYLGDDCLKEFMDHVVSEDKGLFVLVKTSNPSSGQLQDLRIDSENERVYEKVAKLVDQWHHIQFGKNGYSSVGAVVGATYPEELERMRKMMPSTFFLVPGYGAQGGGAKDIINAFDSNGKGAIINSSRGIIFAYQSMGMTYKEASRRAVLNMKNDIQKAIASRK